MALKRLFVDMDGTLAKFHDEDRYLERMFEKDFFRNLSPFENLTQGLNKFSEAYPDVEIFILSATVQGEPPYCRTEKHAWCDKHLPFIDREHRIFTPVGKNKTEFIPGIITKNDFLYDNYNINLEEWQQAGGHSIKCKNNINHKGLIGSLWQGDIVNNCKAPTNIVGELAFFMELPPHSQQLFVSKGKGR